MFQSSVSGLQRLFSSASSSLSPHTQRGQRQLESVTEEAHTYDLLYPECDALLQGQHHAYPLRHGDPAFIAAAANSTDDRGGLDIQSPRDVRIVIAQDATIRSPQPRVLYDSCPPLQSSQARNGYSPDSAQNGRPRAESFTGGLTGGGMRRNTGVRKSNTAPHSRNSSLSQATGSLLTSPGLQLSPVNEIGGLFGNTKSRSGTTRPATSDGETAQGKFAREAREETEALLECMFGAATGFPSTSSTKLHVRPRKSEDINKENRPLSATRESAPPASFPKRRTPLTRSTTAADLQSLSVDATQQGARQNSSAIWITRLFSVDPKEPALATRNSPGLSTQEHSKPHQKDELSTLNDDVPATKKEKVKQLKTPTYAIAILLQMPSHRQRPVTPSMPRSGSTPSSPKLWPFDGSSSFNMPGVDSNSDIEYVIGNWNAIDRALSSLEVVARCKISDALGRLEVPRVAAPIKDPALSPESGSNISPKKRKQPTQYTLQLSAGALQESPFIRDIVDVMGRRVALALKIRKVVSGQGRWGIWREEARWVDKWAGGREQNFFFFNLLTAFVGSHTEWLDSLAPKGYRQRHARHPDKGRKENNAIRHRTVIICSDKMAARRLIFLLSAFLPGAHSILVSDGRAQLDSSWSNTLNAQSPPSAVPISREKSLRRTINRRPKDNPDNGKITSHGRAVSFSGSDIIPSEDTPPDSQGQLPHYQSRRPSDAASLRSAALLISADGSVTRKSSTTTTATIKPESSVPVAHFAPPPSEVLRDASARSRPVSGESLAPLSLQRTLSRSESNEQGAGSTDSQTKSGWSSLVSYWSGRRGSSTEDSDPLGSSQEGLGISGVSGSLRSQRSAAKLSQMVDEVSNSKFQQSAKLAGPVLRERSPHREQQAANRPSEQASLPKQIAKSASPEQFPLKLSIDAHDGVVDVDLPPVSSYPSSFGSVASSLGAYTAASSFHDYASSFARSPNPVAQQHSSGAPGYVAGWLRSFHEDFALQAVRPYQGLKKDIKRAMRTEPTPDPPTEDANDTNEWTTVCSTIIADTTKFTITRLSLRRKNATSPHHRANALLEDPNRDISFEEQIVEEPLMDMDPTFIDAVERVLSHSGDSSRVASRNPSRAPSPTRHHHQHSQHQRRFSMSTNATAVEGNSAGLEIPRSRCRSMVLGALEQVAKSVGDEMLASKDRSVRGGQRRGDMPAESTLREGVRKWFCEVDGGQGV